MTESTISGSATRSDVTYTTMVAIPTSPLSADNDLRARGKGQYTCPLGFSCRKGGIDSHGNLTMFERNSSFRLVLRP